PPYRQRPRHVPAPARREERHRQQRLYERVAGVAAVDQAEHLFERKTVLRSQREQDAVVTGGGLQLKVERPAEALAQGQAPGAVDPRAERRVDEELHPARFVEEALEEDLALRRDES